MGGANQFGANDGAKVTSLHKHWELITLRQISSQGLSQIIILAEVDTS